MALTDRSPDPFGAMFDMDDPQKRMLIAMGLGLLGGAPGSRRNFGADLGHAGLLGMGAYDAAKTAKMKAAEEAQQREMRQMQMEQMQRQQARQQQMEQLGQRYFNSGAPLTPNDDEGNKMPSAPPSMDWQGYAGALSQFDPMQGLQLQSQLAAMNNKGLTKLGKGEQLIDPSTGRVVAQGSPDLPAGMRLGANGPEFIPEYLEGQQKIRAAGRPQVTVDTRQETEFAKAMGKQYADNYNGILNAGMQAQSKMNTLNRFQNIIGKIPTGKAEPFKAEVAKAAASLGMKVDMEKLSYQEALDALGNEFALTLRNPSGGAGMPGALSDKDREFLVSMVPGLGKTPGGNMKIIEAAKRVAQREAEIAKLARAYKAKTGKFDEGFYEVLAQEFGNTDLFGDLQAQVANLPQSGAVLKFDRTGKPL